MGRFAKLQLLGPATLLALVLGAEGAARALIHAPSSAVLWYVNRRLFAPFHQVHFLLGEAVPLDEFQLWLVFLPLLALTAYGLFGGRSLAVALAANLSLLYAFLLLCGWYMDMGRLAASPLRAQPGLPPIGMPGGVDFVLCSVLLIACMVSCVISHAIYLRAIRNEAHAI
jgi:hypothetical protein